MSNDETRWVVQEYSTNRGKWMYCLGTNNKADAIGHYKLLESMYKNTPHRVVEVNMVRTETVVVGHNGVRYDR